MSRKKPPVWAIATVAALLGGLVGAGAVYAAQRGALADAQARATALKAIITRTTAEKNAALERVEELSPAAEQPNPSAEPTGQTEPTPQPDNSPATPLPSSRFAFVKKLAYGTPGTISLDYADYLTGKKAADAATAHGDESPPPNDYYIVNDNTKLRAFKIAPDATVRLVSRPDGTSEPDGYDATVKEWSAAFNNAGSGALRAAGYWVVIEGDAVVAVREQYIP